MRCGAGACEELREGAGEEADSAVGGVVGVGELVAVGLGLGDSLGLWLGEGLLVTDIAGPRSTSDGLPIAWASAVPPPRATMPSAPVRTHVLCLLISEAFLSAPGAVDLLMTLPILAAHYESTRRVR